MSVHVNRMIRSKRRTVALIVERDGSVTVRAPMKMSTMAIEDFVHKHAEWVKRKQAELQSAVTEQPRRYQAGEQFLYLGRSHQLEIVRNARKKLVLDESFKLAESEQSHAEALFQDWYRKQARKIIGERVSFFAKQFQLEAEKIRITSARTRWGSCSSKGTLSFSWRLLMTPLDVIDYVVVHELAHIVHHNHAKRFWDLVEKWMPDYRERRKQLRRYRNEKI